MVLSELRINLNLPSEIIIDGQALVSIRKLVAAITFADLAANMFCHEVNQIGHAFK
jgi:hypothetical protein